MTSTAAPTTHVPAKPLTTMGQPLVAYACVATRGPIAEPPESEMGATVRGAVRGRVEVGVGVGTEVVIHMCGRQ